VICYFDTSAFVPLLVAEPGSDLCRELWDAADAVASCRLLFVETAAALAQAERLHRITDRQHDRSLRALRRLWAEFDVLEVDASLAQRAAELAREESLRGYDALHCAAAEALDDGDLVVATGDRAVLKACAHLGLAVADTSS
jgi:uncharacterized protein